MSHRRTLYVMDCIADMFLVLCKVCDMASKKPSCCASGGAALRLCRVCSVFFRISSSTACLSISSFRVLLSLENTRQISGKRSWQNSGVQPEIGFSLSTSRSPILRVYIGYSESNGRRDLSRLHNRSPIAGADFRRLFRYDNRISRLQHRAHWVTRPESRVVLR